MGRRRHSGEDEDQLAGAWFLGAPLAMQGQVYVLTEIAGEIRLVVLDADTGKLQWWQQLCLVENFTPIHLDTERKLPDVLPRSPMECWFARRHRRDRRSRHRNAIARLGTSISNLTATTN